jgi:IclR family transcriptional regulator, KDG regulon repressor
MLGTISRVGRVLDLFSVEAPEWGVTEVGKALGLPKSTAHALMTTMAEIEILRRTPKNRYCLGWRILALGEILGAASGFREEALPVMDALVKRTGETVNLATWENGRVVYVAQLDGTRAVRIVPAGIGSTVPAHGSAVGKALLASRRWQEVERVVAENGLAELTLRTITRLDELRAELARVRTRGYAYDFEEAAEDVACVAAPVRSYSGDVLAAISIVAPAYRFALAKDSYTSAVVAAASEITRRVGRTLSPRPSRQEWPPTEAIEAAASGG